MVMKLVILGTNAGFATENEACSSYLVSCGDNNYLVDPGAGALSELQRHISYTDIDGVFISHFHADHFSDLYTLRYAVFRAQRERRMKKPVPIYMPGRPARKYTFVRTSIQKEFSITVIRNNAALNMNGLEVRFLRVHHVIPAYAMKFTYGKRTIVYTSDTSYFDRLVDFCSGADILLSEATLQNRNKKKDEPGHMTAGRAGKLAMRARVGKVLLTHLWPENDRSVSLREAKASFANTALARRGKEYIL